MINVKNIIDSYDLYKNEEGKIDIEKMSEEEIDDIINLQGDMVSQLEALVLFKKIKSQIRLKAEKEERNAETLIKRIMARLDVNSHDFEAGKVKRTLNYKYDIKQEELPQELLMPNHASIRAKVNKGEIIEGVTPTIGYFTVSIN